MKNLLRLILPITLFLIIYPFQFSIGQSTQEKPKIIIGLMVDQMRWDFLYRYQNRYGEDGFKRLLKEGFSCENTMINYAPTITGCGHASVYTGSVPAIHGIAGNSWPILSEGKNMNCVGDIHVDAVGSKSSSGKASPKNLLTTTIGDELKIATNFRSKVVGVSIKDRGAILPAGRSGDGAFWFDYSTGHFITSTWYMKELPAWVNEFNKRELPKSLIQSNWNTLFPVHTYKQSTEDDKVYEGKLSNFEKSPIFPHILTDPESKRTVSAPSTPFGNTLVLEFAKAALEGYRMGQGEDTDLLAISLSTPDDVGHRFGPNSIEIEDTYLRLDQELAAFFKYLDDSFGKDGYLFFITADHGVSHSPGFLAENKLPSGTLNKTGILRSINEEVKKKFGIDSAIRAEANYQLYLNRDAIAGIGADQKAIENLIVDLMKKEEGIMNAIPVNQLSSSTLPETIKTMFTNGYHAKRGGDIFYILNSGWIEGSTTGASHGSWYPYDAHIPLVWMGWGIDAGKTHRTVNMTDIAPTIAALLNIQMPSGNVGQVITEITNK